MSTIRQRLVASKMVENGGNIGKAMVAAGYSPSTAKTPQKLTESRGWQELMDKYFPDEFVLKIHRDLLHASHLAQFEFPSETDDTNIRNIIENNAGFKIIQIVRSTKYKTSYFLIPDNGTRIRALDSAYKLKSRYLPNKEENSNLQLEVDRIMGRLRDILPRAKD